jgi:hypothetical protein
VKQGLFVYLISGWYMVADIIYLFFRSRYGIKGRWRADLFSEMVNETDEALVMQVVRYYFPRWDKGEKVAGEDGSEESNDAESTDVGSKHSGGAEKGERLTCTRTAMAFYDYVRKVKTARASPYRAMWDKKLQIEAIRRDKEDLDKEERKRQIEEGEKENEAADIRTVFNADIMNGCWGGNYGADELPTTTAV